jgi:Domain of unknown function (DUF1996)
VARGLRHRLFGVVLVGIALLVAGCIPVASTPTPPTSAPVEPSTLLQPGAPNPYGHSGKGEFVATCTLSHRATVDPIVAPGNTAFWHVHDFFGNTSTDESSTVDTLLGQPTTCITAFDTAAYWVPTLLQYGTPVDPVAANVFYRVVSPENPAKVKPFPTGLKIVAGNATATSAQPGNIVQWRCASSPTYGATIPDCHGANLEFDLHFPECWDGVHLDFADHKSHMAYAGAKGCPADYPVLLPQITYQLQWPVSGDGVTVSSDHTMGGTDVTPGLTAHGDFINSWNPETLQQRVATCLRTAKICDRDGTIIGS